ncbi:GRB2-associated-binding protein 4 isoform 2 [Homo sapiens]|uniref:GRB2-associated-binding protein 4 isoform 2 n=1 Tax=Homo sapiens TaxID=9606 RepID=UPI000D0C9314|nr:GRB2-associated-binding protein 4 isoform 2 [Homo sapiens]|eukprot:XP_024307924.1 GRB2-associated-binding protein 4 isoform X3 [Homo sapiens]
MSLPSPSPSRELCPPDPAFAPLSSWPGSGPAGGSTRSGHVLYSGWLRKSPPEKKLRLFAWRKRWFILRRGQTSSDPDVLEYYKNDGSKKPLRTINLNLCEQLDVDVTLNFNKKEIQKGYMFDIKTSERTFYLVAETREDMNEWVQSICQICGFRQEESTASSGKYTQHGGGNASRPAESMHEGVCSFLPGRTLVGLSDSIASEGSCVPMNPGSPTLPAVKQAGDDSQGVCIPVGSCLVRFDLLGSPLTELSMHQDLSQGHEVQLPPVNRSLKPNQKANPTPPNLRNNRVINELSFKPPVTEPWSGTSHTFDSSSSQHPISTQSITNTDSEDSGERYLFPNPASAFPVSGGTSSSAPPRSTGNIHYAALDFQPSKPSIGSVTSGKKVDYVQVDLEKTQALQKTMHEQMCLRQSSEPPRGAKL